ncbi:MAG: dTMP kinase [Chloroflexi bacterium]|nr:dTMP kinase [Chloroflexota bacterium]
MSAVFITFEGIEGSGKSVQARQLADRLRSHGLRVLATREPGGTSLGDALRDLLLNRDDLQVTARAEALMMNAARAQHVDQVIRPALARGEVVVCDRFGDSTRVYQGAGRGLDKQALNSVISFATAGLHPDLTILLDLPVDDGLKRKHGHEEWNRFEAETRDFHERVRQAYLALAGTEPRRWQCFDARKPAAELGEDIWQQVAARLDLFPSETSDSYSNSE